MHPRSRKLALVLLVTMPDVERPIVEPTQPHEDTMADVQRSFWQEMMANITLPPDAGTREVAAAMADAGSEEEVMTGEPEATEGDGAAATEEIEEDAGDAAREPSDAGEEDAGDGGAEDAGPEVARHWPPPPQPSPVVDGRIDGFATSIGIGKQSTGTGIGQGSTGDGIGPRTGTQGFGTGQGVGPQSTGHGSGVGQTGDGIGPNTGTQGFGTGINIGEDRQGTQGFGTSIGIGPNTGAQGFGTGIGIGQGTTGYGLVRPWADAGAR